MKLDLNDFESSNRKLGYKTSHNSEFNLENCCKVIFGRIITGGLYSHRHFGIAYKSTTLSEAVAHSFLGFVEVIPIIGSFIALAERARWESSNHISEIPTTSPAPQQQQPTLPIQVSASPPPNSSRTPMDKGLPSPMETEDAPKAPLPKALAAIPESLPASEYIPETIDIQKSDRELEQLEQEHAQLHEALAEIRKKQSLTPENNRSTKLSRVIDTRLAFECAMRYSKLKDIEISLFDFSRTTSIELKYERAQWLFSLNNLRAGLTKEKPDAIDQKLTAIHQRAEDRVRRLIQEKTAVIEPLVKNPIEGSDFNKELFDLYMRSFCETFLEQLRSQEEITNFLNADQERLFDNDTEFELYHFFITYMLKGQYCHPKFALHSQMSLIPIGDQQPIEQPLDEIFFPASIRPEQQERGVSRALTRASHPTGESAATAISDVQKEGFAQSPLNKQILHLQLQIRLLKEKNDRLKHLINKYQNQHEQAGIFEQEIQDLRARISFFQSTHKLYPKLRDPVEQITSISFLRGSEIIALIVSFNKALRDDIGELIYEEKNRTKENIETIACGLKKISELVEQEVVKMMKENKQFYFHHLGIDIDNPKYEIIKERSIAILQYKLRSKIDKLTSLDKKESFLQDPNIQKLNQLIEDSISNNELDNGVQRPFAIYKRFLEILFMGALSVPPINLPLTAGTYHGLDKKELEKMYDLADGKVSDGINQVLVILSPAFYFDKNGKHEHPGDPPGKGVAVILDPQVFKS